MAPQSTSSRPYGKRLLPQVLDEVSAGTPQRLYASVPRGIDLTNGFRDVSVGDMARCSNYMAHWIEDNLGRSKTFETLSYIGIPDLRSVPIFLGAVKCGYKLLLPSPRNPPATNISLMQQTACSTILHAAEVAPLLKQLQIADEKVVCLQVPAFEDMLGSSPQPYHYEKDFKEVRNDPIVVLHSSGSTGLPKPIIMTHGTFAILDNERNLPTTSNRKNRDFSVWDFQGGGRFYTIFPYFHLAGFLSLIVNPIFTEFSSPVLGPPLAPPSGSLLKEVMKHQNLRALYLPPAVPEQLLLEPNGIDFFKGLEFLAYTGGPFSLAAGERLSAVTELCPLYGSTEAFQVPQLKPSPEDWAWMEWNPHFKFEMQLYDAEEGSFEIVLFADDSTTDISALNHNMPGTSVYHTKDLFKRHPKNDKLWQYYARKDDIIVLSNGEKFNPVPMELAIQGHASVAGALVVGQGKSQAALLIEPKPELDDASRKHLTNMVWPNVEQANQTVPGQGRIILSHILTGSANKPFVRAGKGTIVRKLTEARYIEEINALYTEATNLTLNAAPSLKPTLTPVYEMEAIQKWVRSLIVNAFPAAVDVLDDDDLYSYGLDSLKSLEIIKNLNSGLRDILKTEDGPWISLGTIHSFSTVHSLSTMLSQLLNRKSIQGVESQVNRVARMNNMIEKYTHDLPPKSASSKSFKIELKCVALVGSTGYVGPFMAASLLRDEGVSFVFCLNRTVDAQKRTEERVTEIGVDIRTTRKKLKFLTISLGEYQLELSDPDYQIVLADVDAIIYNSWNSDFSLPLQSFEKPFLQGLRNLIDWSKSSIRAPRIVFISSISSAGNWSKVHKDQKKIPESLIRDCNVAIEIGYGESKCVAECILAVASERSGVPVSIVRTGQISGESRTSSSVPWAVQDWLLSIIKTSKALGIAPTHVALLDWMPVDRFADAVSHVVQHSDPGSSDIQVFNLTHPLPAPWSFVMQTLKEGFNIDAKLVKLPDWAKRVEEAWIKGSRDISDIPAVKFLDFFKSLGEGREEMQCETSYGQRIPKIEVEPITAERLAAWFGQWDF